MREETRLVRQFIRDAATKGEQVTYEAIEKHVNWKRGSSQTKNRSVLYSAFRWLEKEHGFYAVNIPKVGYNFSRGGKALSASELHRTQKIRSQVDKIVTTYENCKADATSQERLIHENKIAFLEFAVAEKTQQEIERIAAEKQKKIDWSEELRRARHALLEAMSQDGLTES